MHDVFISYSTKDMDKAEAVRDVLEKNSIPCWMAPRDIPGGSNYSKEIPVAIRNCQVFLLVLSQNAQASQWVLKELDSAVNCGKVIIPFMLEEVPLSDEFNFLLTGAQRYAAYQKKSEVIEMLIGRIRAITGVAKPQQQPVAQQKPAAVEKLLASDTCPSCGGKNIRVLSKKIGKYTLKEKLWLLALPIGIILGLLAGLLLGTIMISVINFNYSAESTVITVCLLLGVVAGGWFGCSLPREQIRRMRVREGMNPHPFRCEDCKKEFLMKK